ncbi:MAG TPA: hypothetical protein VFS83_12950 [Ktedonobacterales bacterium]|nr:hypothetical protein [Ktedonobacterales bacterium]
MPDNASTTDMSGDSPLDTPTQSDIILEGARLVDLATTAGLSLRLLGGVAVRMICPSAGLPPLARTYGDLDFAAPRREGRAMREVLERAGYTGERHFNALHGDKRLLYVDESRGRKVDVFLGAFRMCHTLDLEARLKPGIRTLTPSDLLLTKLQIVQLNAKDAQDTLALLADHELSNHAETGHEDDVIDIVYIAELCAHDWGWYTTVSDNLTRVEQVGGELGSSDAIARSIQRITRLRSALEQAPKSLSWRMRAAVGRRVAWFEEPEEIRQ